jgi:ankyrin repeat protein
MLRFLVQQGLDIHVVDSQGDSPLHEAAQGGHVDAVRYLVEAGVDLHADDLDGRTPLSDALVSGHMEVVNYLLAQGAQLDSLHSAKYSGILGVEAALHRAVYHGSLQAVQILVQQGLDLQAVGICGTPLQSAVRWGHYDIARYLVEQGADVNPTEDRHSPLYLALQDRQLPSGVAKDPGFCRFLLHHGAKLRGDETLTKEVQDFFQNLTNP